MKLWMTLLVALQLTGCAEMIYDRGQDMTMNQCEALLTPAERTECKRQARKFFEGYTKGCKNLSAGQPQAATKWSVALSLQLAGQEIVDRADASDRSQLPMRDQPDWARQALDGDVCAPDEWLVVANEVRHDGDAQALLHYLPLGRTAIRNEREVPFGQIEPHLVERLCEVWVVFVCDESHVIEVLGLRRIAEASHVRWRAIQMTPTLKRAVRAVAPRGTLLFIAHDIENLTKGFGGPQHLEMLCANEQIVDVLGDELVCEMATQPERRIKTPDSEKSPST